MSHSILEELLSLFNNCLENGIIPSQFELAYLYPIPKPQWWNYDINLTRPIILLDCIRKLLIKIINGRLNHYLSNNQILQHNNQAGVQGASCNKIILQIQAIIDHQHDTKNPFFLAIQDLSKAYDRVDLDLLKLALRRINIPEILISFINKLFSNYRNKIILPFGYGSEYTTTNGIIQGEVISPLLWVIYYDPMFKAINDSTFSGYKLYASMPRNIFRKNDLHEKLIEIKLLGYLDDTTWFATNLKDLQNNLAIADDFYALANIKINKDKTKILTNDFKINKKQHILIKFGNDIVKDGAEIAFPNLQYCGFKN
ncbi:RNA-directed DNA polymerase from mobile element jockey-like [Rhizophagus irregularis DAOM 181602=DAOM 197198]|nr:RNA-directed DNA polymerase from mobile element jockey-like [Rhizophagus irregularis DAOM 181602=DAOM 197198]